MIEKLRMKKIFSSLFVLLVCVILWSFMSHKHSAERYVKTVPIDDGPISSYLSVSGVIKGARSVDVISRIPGHLTEVLVSEGDNVEAGQLLAQLDDAEAKAKVMRAQALMERLNEKVSELHRKLRRVKEVKVNGGESTQAVEDVQTEFNDTKAELKVKQADYQLQEINLKLHRVVAPFSGLVVHRNAEVGQAVQPALGEATTLFTVVDDSTLYIEAQVDAGDSGALTLTSLVEVVTDAWPELVWEEQIFYIAKVVNKQDHDGVNTFIIKISLGKSAPPLLIGQQVDLKIRTAHRDNAIMIQHNAIIEAEAGPQVAIVEDNRIILRSVKTGIQSITHTEIISGLSKNDLVVLPEGRQFKTGDQVLMVQ